MCIEAGGIEWLAQNTVSYPVGTQVSIEVLPENIQIMHKPQSEDAQAIVLDDFLRYKLFNEEKPHYKIF